MKKFVDFQNADGPLAKAVDMVIGLESTASAEEADIVFTDEVDNTLRYLQQTEKRVVQFAHSQHHPLTHLEEQYPQRFRVFFEKKDLAENLRHIAAIILT